MKACSDVVTQRGLELSTSDSRLSNTFEIGVSVMLCTLFLSNASNELQSEVLCKGYFLGSNSPNGSFVISPS